MRIYMAPMEGVTDSIYRNTFREFYGGVDKYFTPFLSPNSTRKFTTREWKEIDPATNDVATTVPQLIGNNAENMLWAMEELANLGYREININLGCPSGTVVSKKKGSGLLYYPEELERLFGELFEGGAKLGLNISVKTRLGKNDPEEFYEILDIYNRYPISELTIHPRIQSDFYKGQVRREYFDYAYEKAKMPLVYNGDLKKAEEVAEVADSYPRLAALMLGRGLVARPWMLAESELTMAGWGKFWNFHDSLLGQYLAALSGQVPLLHRMKEFWAYWDVNFSGADCDKLLKKLRKAKKLEEYAGVVEALKGLY